MTHHDGHSISHHLDMSSIDFISLLDRLDDGVIITDINGTIIFYNHAQAKMDGLEIKDVLGLKVTDIYSLNERTSMVMQCIDRRAAIKNRTFFYRTISGKVANTITSVYPLFKEDQVSGTVCFVKDYEFLQRSTPMSASHECRPDLGNSTRFTFADLIGSAPDFQRAVHIARKAANSNSPIMLYGETGTGKELFAQSIHNHSTRRKKKYVAVNCAAIPDDLLEGLLFGTTKGAFTGAMDKAGLFEMANDGTIFLDELLAMPVHLQAKLLRVLQEKKVRRVGSHQEVDVNAKIISSVSSDPRLAIQQNELRIDLYYRLGVVLIKIPPLRKRREGMTELINHFIDKLNDSLGTHVKRISSGVLELFMAYHWPGNVRELEHLMEGAMNLVGQEETIDVKHFSPGMDAFVPIQPREAGKETNLSANGMMPMALEGERERERQFNGNGIEPNTGTGFYPGTVNNGHQGFEPQTDFQAHGTVTTSTTAKGLAQSQAAHEKEAVIQALGTARGNVTRAAKQLGISRQLLHYKIKKHGLQRKHFL